jgi:hypothetical protein
MKRITSIAVIAVALAGLAGACAQTSNADVSRKHLSLVGQDAKATTFDLVDLGKPGFGATDQLIEENPLTNSAGKTVGSAYTVFTITSGKSPADGKGLIDCSINLAGGRILFNGFVDLAKLGKGGEIVPVVGGTGAYAGTGGTVRMTSPDPKHTNMSFDLLIPKTS